MPPPIKSLTDDTIAAVHDVLRWWRQQPGNTRGRNPAPDHVPPAPEVYIARTPFDGIPALTPAGHGTGTGTFPTTGTGTGFSLLDRPGHAECEVWRILPNATTAVPELNDAGFSKAPVYNLGLAAVPGDAYVVIARDKFGSWLVAGAAGGASGAGIVVRCVDVVAGQVSYVDCSTGTGTGLADDCGFIFHHGFVQVWDAVCQRWGDGPCVMFIEVEGRRAIPGHFYAAQLVGVTPSVLQGILNDPTQPPCRPEDNGPLYAVDLGTPTRTIKVGTEVGKLCNDPGTGTGTGTPTGLPGPGGLTTAPADDQNLIIYQGQAYEWNAGLCAWVYVEDCLVANASGCELDVAEFVSGHYNSMVAARLVPTVDMSAAAGCLPLYITTERPFEPAVGNVKCVNGILQVYMLRRRTDGACGTELVFDHTAGCCSCSGSGSQGFGACGFPATPTGGYNLVISGVTNGTPPTGCDSCTTLNGTWNLTFDSNTCWTRPFSFGCAGIACPILSLCCTTLDGVEYMVASICGAQYRILKSSFDALGNNTLDLFGTPYAGCGYPPTIQANAA